MTKLYEKWGDNCRWSPYHNHYIHWLHNSKPVINERHWSAKPLAQHCMWLYLCVNYNRSLSCDSLGLAMRILLCSCLCKVCSWVSDALSQALCNLSLVFLADFTLSAMFHTAFSCKLHSAFRLDRKTWSQRSHVFLLTGTVALQTSGIALLEAYLLPINNGTCKERLSQEQNGH